jgi:hypothetical protein
MPEFKVKDLMQNPGLGATNTGSITVQFKPGGEIGLMEPDGKIFKHKTLKFRLVLEYT